MTVEFYCDWCGKREEGSYNYQGLAMKPHKWYQRTITEDDKKITQVACSRKCLNEIGGSVAPW